MRYLAALWCARRHRPYAIVEDPELVAIFQMLYSKVELPSRFSISRDVLEMFAIARRHLRSILIVRDVVCTV